MKQIYSVRWKFGIKNDNFSDISIAQGNTHHYFQMGLEGLLATQGQMQLEQNDHTQGFLSPYLVILQICILISSCWKEFKHYLLSEMLTPSTQHTEQMGLLSVSSIFLVVSWKGKDLLQVTSVL